MRVNIKQSANHLDTHTEKKTNIQTDAEISSLCSGMLNFAATHSRNMADEKQIPKLHQHIEEKNTPRRIMTNQMVLDPAANHSFKQNPLNVPTLNYSFKQHPLRVSTLSHHNVKQNPLCVPTLIHHDVKQNPLSVSTLSHHDVKQNPLRVSTLFHHDVKQNPLSVPTLNYTLKQNPLSVPTLNYTLKQNPLSVPTLSHHGVKQTLKVLTLNHSVQQNPLGVPTLPAISLPVPLPPRDKPTLANNMLKGQADTTNLLEKATNRNACPVTPNRKGSESLLKGKRRRKYWMLSQAERREAVNAKYQLVSRPKRGRAIKAKQCVF